MNEFPLYQKCNKILAESKDLLIKITISVIVKITLRKSGVLLPVLLEDMICCQFYRGNAFRSILIKEDYLT